MPRARTAILCPVWNDDVKRWTAGFLHANVWRCDTIHGVDDLMQDAYLLFAKLTERYPRVTTQASFMKLYKQSMRNALHDHARGMLVKRECIRDEYLDLEGDLMIGDTTNLGEVLLELEDLPPPIVQCLRLLATKPELLLTEIDKRENFNKKFLRLLGIEVDFRSLRTLLREEPC